MKKLIAILTVLCLFSACSKDENDEIDDTPTAKSADDYRGLMRDFVTKISKIGKSAKSGFVVIPQNGIQLVTTTDESDGPLAEQYLAAIDGHGQEDIFYGNPDDNVASSNYSNDNYRHTSGLRYANGTIVEDAELHANVSSIKIEESSTVSPSRVYQENDANIVFYNQDVPLIITVEDSFSGISEI